MKEKNKLIKRIGAIVFALVVVVTSFGASVPYFASDSSSYYDMVSLDFKNNHFVTTNIEFTMEGLDIADYPYYAIRTNANSSRPLRLTASKSRFVPNIFYRDSVGDYELGLLITDSVSYDWDLAASCWIKSSSSSGRMSWQCLWFYEDGRIRDRYVSRPIYINHDIFLKDSDVLFYDCLEDDTSVSFNYNPSLGYLQNISRKSTYIRDALYNYDEDSLTYHWYHGTTTTSGLDLTGGNYAVRHYISMATVMGYEKEDIVEMSDKYLMAEYDASQGYFSYLDKDYDEKLESLGYEGIDWIEKYLKGYFILQHHYLQIVNLDTNEVGGYVHLYPKDSDSNNFGVELNHEGLDDNFEVDEDAPSGIVDDSTGSGTTTDDALENADEPKLDDLSGVDEFIEVVKAYGQEVGNVSSGVGALLGIFPPWILGVLGLAFVFIIVCIIVNSMKG